MTDRWPCFCFYFLNFPLIHVQHQHASEQHASQNLNGPLPILGILSMLKHLQLHLLILNSTKIILLNISLRFIWRGLTNVLSTLVLLPVVLGIIQHSFYIVSRNTVSGMTWARYPSFSKSAKTGLVMLRWNPKVFVFGVKECKFLYLTPQRLVDVLLYMSF